MGKRNWIAGAILAWCCASAAYAQDEATVAHVEALLRDGVEPAGTEEKLLALGQPGERALWRLFETPTAARYVRLRALSALSWFETTETAQRIVALVRSAQGEPGADPLHPAHSVVVLQRALESLTQIAQSGVRPTIRASELEFALGHADAHVRRAAATLLASIDGADPLLARQLARESSRMVRASVERAISLRARRK
jgi:hypothetical protein